MKCPHKNPPSRVLPLLVIAAVITGCATTEMTAQWKDPAYGSALTGSRVLVLCQARDDTLRRVCEDQWATRLAAHGVAGIRSYSLPGFPPGGAANPEEMATAGRESGATAVASTQLVLSDFAVVNPGPQVGFGLGGDSGGGYRGGGFSVGGIGLSFPIGGATTTRNLGSSTSLVDLASSAVIWSGSATTSARGDVTSQVGALTEVTIEALKKAGLIR
jgi:uncharacterized membrane protein YgcG